MNPKSLAIVGKTIPIDGMFGLIEAMFHVKATCRKEILGLEKVTIAREDGDINEIQPKPNTKRCSQKRDPYLSL